MRLNLSKSVPLGTIALALSIGLHGLFLGLPLPQRNASEPEQTAAEILEPVAIRPTAPPIASPKPRIPPSPQSTPEATPEAAPKPAQRSIVRPAPAVVAVPSPVPSPVASPVAVSPSPAATPDVSPVPPAPSPSPSPSPEPFAADFPHFENAEAGCFGLETCHQVESEVSFREVGRTMMAQLEAKGYTVRLRDDLADDTGRKVYEVSKDDETQYLSVLSALDLGRTVYVLAEKPVTIADLQSASGDSLPL